MTSKPRVLLVDDERAITSNLAPFLERAGFEAAIAADGEEALDQVERFAPQLIVLDVLMPRLGGREVLRRLRQEGNWTPVILLTQVGESTERAMALEEGADDYLNKPFDPHELVARIRAVLRRARPGQPPLTSAQKLVCGQLVLDRPSRRAYLASEELHLTPKAAALLEYLMTHPDELLTRDRLLDNALKFTHPGDTVEVRAFDDGSVVVIEVADTGPGIPKDEIARVWEELYRGREARGVPGSGLGLALVRAVAERHDGHVSVRSRVGQGTVVRMTLPVR